MTRWSHSHSLAAGLAGGLLFAQHAAILAAACFLAGIAATMFATRVRRISRGAAARAAHEHDLHLALVDAKVDTERARGRHYDQRVRTRAEQDAELDRAYKRGALDASDWRESNRVG